MSDLPTKTTENYNESGSKLKSWQHAWTIDEMRSEASNWRLASDVGMLLHLEDFAHRLLSRTHDIQEQVDGVMHEAKLTDIRLNNVFNDFIMLANTQFIENRVYDEELTSTSDSQGCVSASSKELSKGECEAMLLSRIKNAICLGVNILDTDFEKLSIDVSHSDSEPDDNDTKATAVMFEPKDPYMDRMLPYLIGSDEFDCNDDVGLQNTLFDDERHESEADDSKHIATTTTGGPAGQQHVCDSSSEEGEDLFAKVQHASGRNGWETGDLKVNASETVSQVSTEQQVKPVQLNRKFDDADLFGASNNEEVDEDDDDIFSRPSGLFADNNDLKQHQLFGDQPGAFQPQRGATHPLTGANQPPAAVSIGQPGAAQPQPSANQPPAAVSISSAAQLTSKLFSDQADDEDDDDDLFNTSHVKSQKATKPVSLFADDSRELEVESDSLTNVGSVTRRKIPAGAVAVFAVSADNQFNRLHSSEVTVESTVSQTTSNVSTHSPRMNSDLLTTSQRVNKNTQQQTATSMTASNSAAAAVGKCLFGDDINVDDDDDDDDLFSTMPKTSATKSKQQPEHAVKVKNVQQQPQQQFTKKPLSLFDSDDDDNVVNNDKDVDEAANLFAAKFSVSGALPAVDNIQVKSNGNMSLFADDELFATHDDNPSFDLFASTQSPASAGVVASTSDGQKTLNTNQSVTGSYVHSSTDETGQGGQNTGQGGSSCLVQKVPSVKEMLFAGLSDEDDDIFEISSLHKPSAAIGSESSRAVPLLSTQQSSVGGNQTVQHTDKCLSANDSKTGEVKSASAVVSQLQAKLAINPSALLPHQPVTAVTCREHTDQLDLTQPVHVEPLLSLAKSRARLQTKRRPPSRHQLCEQETSCVLPVDGTRSSLANNATCSLDVSADLSAVTQAVTGLSQPLVDSGPAVVTESLFTSKFAHSEPIAANDIHISTANKTQQKLLDNDVDDIFADSHLLENRQSTKTKSQLPSVANVAASGAGDVDDDIFGTDTFLSSTFVRPISSRQPTLQSHNIFDNDDNDDIFTVSVKSTGQVAQVAAIVDYQLPTPHKSLHVRKKPTTRDEVLFNDDTNIFADISVTEACNSKMPQKTTSSVVSPVNTRDIFASHLTFTETKKTSKVQPILDDDPLNALNSE